MKVKSKFDDCVKSVVAKYDSETITEDQAISILEEFDEKIKPIIDNKDAVRRKAQEVIAERIKLTREQQYSAYLQIKNVVNKTNEVMGHYNRIDITMGKALEGILVGNNFIRNSAGLAIRTGINNEVKAFVDPIKKIGMLDAVKTGQADEQILRFILEEDVAKIKPTTPEAILGLHYKNTNLRLNAELRKRGVFIDEIEAYVKQSTEKKVLIKQAKEYAARTGDKRDLKEISFELWFNDAKHILDWEKNSEIYNEAYFKRKARLIGKPVAEGDMNAMRFELVKKMHDNIFTGVHNVEKYHTMLNAFNTGSAGKMGMAKIQNRKRNLWFKRDASLFNSYNQKYSGKTLTATMLETIEEKTRLMHLIDAFGPDYKTGYQRIKNTMLARARDGDDSLKQIDSLGGKLRFNPDNAFAELTGEAMMVENNAYHFWGKALRSWQTVTHLGNVFLSMQLDRPIFHSVAVENGLSNMQAITANLSSYFKKYKDDAELRHTIETISAGISTELGGTVGRLFSDGSTKLGGVMENFVKMTGMKFHDESMRYSFVGSLINNMGRRAEQSFEALPDSMRKVLESYGITARDWDIARKDVWELPESDLSIKQRIISPDKITDKVVSDKFANYINGETYYAVLSPTEREAAIMRMGVKEGTLASQLIKSFMQFKSFPITMLTKILERQYAKHGATKILSLSPEAMKGHLSVFTLAAEMTIGGMLVTQLREILKGREPKPWDSKLIYEGMVRGGSLAILGDFVLTEYDRHYRYPLTQFAGPVLGDLAEGLVLASEISRGKVNKGAILRDIKSNIPYQLPYVMPIANTMFLYSLEAAFMEMGENNNRYWKDKDRMLRKYQGTGFSKTNPLSPLNRVETFE